MLYMLCKEGKGEKRIDCFEKADRNQDQDLWKYYIVGLNLITRSLGERTRDQIN